MSQMALTDERALHREAAVPARVQWRRPSVRLALLFAALTCLGLVMVASVTGGRDTATAITKRLIYTAVGLVAFLFGAVVDYRQWRRHSLLVLVATLTTLAAVVVWGIRLNGASRWMRTGLGGMTFQPSEFAKLGLCIWLAAYCERHVIHMRNFVEVFFAPLCVVGLAALLILLEPDFGTTVLIATVCVAVLVVMGTRLIHVAIVALAAVPLGVLLVVRSPYRMQRIVAFADPWADAEGSGYQLIQSLIALGSGGWRGLGPGAGIQKAGFLPGTDNDFIFSVIGEELGFIGCMAVIALFVLVLWEGLKVVQRARDPFGFALAFGLLALIGLQAAAHIAVVTGCVPTKGLSLPFISAGGSSLVASMAAAGLLVNIALSEERPGRAEPLGWEDEVPAYERWFGRRLRRMVPGFIPDEASTS